MTEPGAREQDARPIYAASVFWMFGDRVDRAHDCDAASARDGDECGNAGVSLLGCQKIDVCPRMSRYGTNALPSVPLFTCLLYV